MNYASIALVSIVLSSIPAAVRAGVTPAAPAPNVAPPAAAPAAVKAKMRVQILGRVKRPGDLLLDDGARLSDALATSGAYAIEKLVARLGGEPVPDTECVLGGTELRFVYLMRTRDDSRTVSYAIDVTRAQSQHDLRYDPVLEDNDKIYVPDCRDPMKIIAPRFPIPES